MKTPLTFLLALTFLFLFSGSVYGDEFGDNHDLWGVAGMDHDRLYELAKEGNAKAQYTFGLDYSGGLSRGQVEDYAKAMKWFLLAAEQGHALSQYYVGRYYNIGQGVSQDFKTALKWYRLSAMQGDKDAQLSIGFLYHNGYGVTQNNALAYAWYLLSGAEEEYGTLLEKELSPEQKSEAQTHLEVLKQKVAEAKRTKEEEQEKNRVAEEKKREVAIAKASKGFIPEKQKEFLNIIKTYADKYENAKTDLKKSFQRKKRNKEFKKFFSNGFNLKNWVGKIIKIDTNASGDARLLINLAGENLKYFYEGVNLNNYSTPIKLEDELFDKVVDMESGDKVVFSGKFKEHDEILTTGWYLYTYNPTEKGAMVSPIFGVGYSDVSRIKAQDSKAVVSTKSAVKCSSESGSLKRLTCYDNLPENLKNKKCSFVSDAQKRLSCFDGDKKNDDSNSTNQDKVAHEKTFTLTPQQMDTEYEKSEEAKKKNNWVLAKDIVEPLAENGHAKSQRRLGSIYLWGLGEVPKDLKKALKWLKLGAEQGDAAAQYNLAGMYGRGDGVPQDFKEAVKWYRPAAEQGLPEAQLNLGGMYYEGDGVSQNYVLAHMWWNLAAEQRNIGFRAKSAIKNRNLVEKRMTKQQIEKAQEMARNWKPTKK